MDPSGSSFLKVILVFFLQRGRCYHASSISQKKSKLSKSPHGLSHCCLGLRIFWFKPWCWLSTAGWHLKDHIVLANDQKYNVIADNRYHAPCGAESAAGAHIKHPQGYWVVMLHDPTKQWWWDWEMCQILKVQPLEVPAELGIRCE